MKWESAGRSLMAASAVLASGCDQLSLGPPQAASVPEAAVVSPVRPEVDFRAEAGKSFSDFVAGAGAQYDPEALGLLASDRARLWRAMAADGQGRLLSGGGAEGLVFRGCAETGCGDGVAVVAVDVATGTAFVAIRDVGGADVLRPNERMEALLRLNSPTRAWDNPAPPAASEAAGQP